MGSPIGRLRTRTQPSLLRPKHCPYDDGELAMRLRRAEEELTKARAAAIRAELGRTTDGSSARVVSWMVDAPDVRDSQISLSELFGQLVDLRRQQFRHNRTIHALKEQMASERKVQDFWHS